MYLKPQCRHSIHTKMFELRVFFEKKVSSLILWGAKMPMFMILTPGKVAVLICDAIIFRLPFAGFR